MVNAYSVDISNSRVYSVRQDDGFANFVAKKQRKRYSSKMQFKGHNPYAAELDACNQLVKTRGPQHFDLGLCVSPCSPDESHSWMDFGMKPSLAQFGEKETLICRWCGGWLQRVGSGWMFFCFGAERQCQADDQSDQRMKNWWDTSQIERTDDTIYLGGELPVWTLGQTPDTS